jgi:hypothetical protein
MSNSVNFAARAATVTKYGIPVIPINPREKKATLDKWQILATTDAAQIAKWNKENPDYNCGAVGRKGEFLILDADRFIGLSEQIERETGHQLDSIDTLMVKSSEGKLHIYFKHDVRSEALGNFSVDDEVGEVFSVRAHNMYVVGPESIHPKTGLAYEVIAEPTFGDIPAVPDWLMDWLENAKKLSNQQKAKISADPEAKIPVGGRDKFLFAEACKLRDITKSQKAALAALMVINLDRCVPPMTEAEVRTKIKSAYTHETRMKPATEFQTDYKESGNNPPIEAPVVTKNGVKFHLPAVTNGTHKDWVFEPSAGMYEGLFPRGITSLLGGTSGIGKTTLLIQFLLAQKAKAPFFNHQASAGYSFAMMGADRGAFDLQRLMESKHLSSDAFPFMRLPVGALDLNLVQAIVNLFEGMSQKPEIVVLEAIDFMVSRMNDSCAVSLFMGALNTFAEYYHLAIIGTTGSAKIKEGQVHGISREKLIGSGAWLRGAATVVTMSYLNDDDSSGKRIVQIEPRHAKAEKLTMEFQDRLLVVVPDEPDETEDKGKKLSEQVAREMEWFEGKARTAKPYFTVQDLETKFGISHPAADRHIKDAVAKGCLVKKPGKKTGKGGANEYRWNESKTNPAWVSPDESEVTFS